MERYDYEQNVKEDVISALEEWFEYHDIKTYSDFDDLVNDIQDDMFNSDNVTGNASGSYTFSTWDAEENICHNMELLGDALSEFGYDGSFIAKYGAERCDVLIRCYVLQGVIRDAVHEYMEEHYPNYDLDNM